MIRLFTGLAIPAGIAAQLDRMQGGIDGARWTETHNYHITLNFIGEVSEAMAEEIDAALCGVRAKAFSLSLAGTGIFGEGESARHLWMGVAPEDALFRLQEKTFRALDTGRFPAEKRKYTPHVTMARLKKSADPAAVAAFMQEHNLFRSSPFAVNEFILYRSDLTKNGPQYAPVATYPLG
jgi:2'-5' RNA ligase